MGIKKERVIAALGMFDGVHVGHQKLLATARDQASREQASVAVYTFSNHPLSVLGGCPRLLTDRTNRQQLLLSAGAQQVEMANFDLALANSTPEQFVDMLRSKWELCGVVAGYNYTFGAKASGTSEVLRRLGEKFGFSVTIIEPVRIGGESVSSSRIRSILESEGDVETAQVFLGRPYRLAGTVVANRGNGRRFGFPTANIQVDPELVIPLSGVYATRAVIGSHAWMAVTNIGTNPTLHGQHLTIETHILDYSGDLYGQHLKIDFHARLRGEQVFQSEHELIDRIAQDVMQARNLLAIKTP